MTNIKYLDISWELNELPKKGEKIIKLDVDVDLSITNFHLAWMKSNMKANKVLIPKNIYISCIDIDTINVITPVLNGDYCIISNPNPDEWWMTFIDSDLIFYSPGA